MAPMTVHNGTSYIQPEVNTWYNTAADMNTEMMELLIQAELRAWPTGDDMQGLVSKWLKGGDCKSPSSKDDARGSNPL